jgi:hypothetical protein
VTSIVCAVPAGAQHTCSVHEHREPYTQFQMLMNMKHLCILFPWRIMLQSASVEHRTIALDEGIKPSQRPSTTARRCAWAIQGCYLNQCAGSRPCNFNCELMKMNGNKQKMCKDEENASSTVCLWQHDAAHMKLRKTSGQSRGEGDGRRRQGEELGITEEGSGGCAICRSRSR